MEEVRRATVLGFLLRLRSTAAAARHLPLLLTPCTHSPLHPLQHDDFMHVFEGPVQHHEVTAALGDLSSLGGGSSTTLVAAHRCVVCT